MHISVEYQEPCFSLSWTIYLNTFPRNTTYTATRNIMVALSLLQLSCQNMPMGIIKSYRVNELKSYFSFDQLVFIVQ